jgi:hypothetical protein
MFAEAAEWEVLGDERVAGILDEYDVSSNNVFFKDAIPQGSTCASPFASGWPSAGQPRTACRSRTSSLC